VLTLPRDTLRDLARACQHEWLLTDGRGGWAGSTSVGLDTRREHGLLVAAQDAGQPVLLLARLEETVVAGSVSEALATVEYPGTIEPAGHRQAVGFALDPLPTLTWEVSSGKISRTVARVHGLPGTVIAYTYEGALPVILELRPLVANRAPAALQGEEPCFSASLRTAELLVVETQASPLHLSVRGGTWQVDGYWYRDHVRRAEPGAPTEDLWSPGLARVALNPGGQVFLVAWAGEIPAPFTASAAMSGERRRLRALGEAPEGLLPELRRASDAFLVRRGDAVTVVAALPGDDDPTAEALVALPGLCLSTGRHDAARGVLGARAQALLVAVRDGGAHAAPSIFQEVLWLAHAAGRFLEATGDRAFFRARLQDVLFLAIETCRSTAREDVHVRSDALLWLEGAAAGPLVGTRSLPEGPGRIYAVEVQALWYNALLTAADAAREGGLAARGKEWAHLAARVRESVLRLFWLESRFHLRDFVSEDAVRTLPDRDAPGPAQLYAVGLPHALLPREKAATVLEGVRRHLLTPRGLRSVAGESIWPHLMGIYFDAVIRIWGEAGKAEAWTWMDGFAPHLGEGCLGQVSQVFVAAQGPGDPEVVGGPESTSGASDYLPAGAPAWAPAVGEILRVLVRLGRRPGRGLTSR
jgi:predicted glycogen debranching enzyme